MSHHSEIYLYQVIVQTLEEKQLAKQQRKEARKIGRMTQDEREMMNTADIIGNGKDLRLKRERQLANAAVPVPKTKAVQEIHYPNVFRASEKTNVFGKQTLPVGTVRLEDDNRYDEIVIPFPERNPAHSVNLVGIDSFQDPLCKVAFKGYKSLNRVQSLVYPIAFNTNENMLVCAPTGAGKTDVAMLTVLRALLQHMNPDGKTIALDDFKIVYVAPMKALAAEIVRKFGSRLSPLNVKVRELTGDMQLTKVFTILLCFNF